MVEFCPSLFLTPTVRPAYTRTSTDNATLLYSVQLVCVWLVNRTSEWIDKCICPVSPSNENGVHLKAPGQRSWTKTADFWLIAVFAFFVRFFVRSAFSCDSFSCVLSQRFKAFQDGLGFELQLQQIRLKDHFRVVLRVLRLCGCLDCFWNGLRLRLAKNSTR